MLSTLHNSLLKRVALALSAGWCSLASPATDAATNEPAPPGEFVFRTWGTEAGLPQNTINALVQTRDGYMWLGTQGGLARFDGVRFTVFGLQDGLPGIQARALYEDAVGNLWIGTASGGLSRMRDGRFENFTLGDGLAGVTVSALTEDASGRLWVGTSDGLILWQGNRLIHDASLLPLEHTVIRSLIRDHRGAIWIGSALGLFEFNDNHLTECIGPESDKQIVSAYCLLEDKAGNIWAGIGNGKVLCRRDGVWVTYNETTGLPFAYVDALSESADGTIWAGSVGAGLYYFRDGRFHAIRKQDGLSDEAIRSLLPDRDGNLWVGMRTTGLERVAHRKVTPLGAAQGLTNDFVRSVAESPDGSLWVATIGGGVCHGWPGRFEPVPTVINSVDYTFMESIVEMRDGNLWWAGSGCLIQSKEGKQITAYTRADCPWLANVTVTALLEDPRGGLWIGTRQGALLKQHDGVVTPIKNRVALGAVTSLAQSPDGPLWVGSVGGGLCQVPDKGNPNFLTNALLSPYVLALHLDREGTLWIGTEGGGLNRLQQGNLARITTREGLGDDTISQILEDDAGDLWLGCNRGIFRVRKAELNELAEGKRKFVHPRAFGLNDGMPAEECSGGSCPAGLKTRSGQLCFSTVRGVVLIDPRQQDVNVRAPRVLLEEVSVGGKLQTLARRPGNAAEEDLPPIELTIAPGQSEFEFHYTGLSFSAPEKVRFRFWLEGLDQGWIEAGTRRVAYFHELPPGDYTFHVSACNADGVWSDETAALGVTVLPHFWETRWFRAAAGFFVVGLSAGLVYWVVRRKYHRRLKLLETKNSIDRERLRISQDMHDDIGSILTRVSILSDLGQGGAEGEVAARGQFERIGNQVRSAVQALDVIVWATNPKNDNLRRFADYVGRFTDEFFENSTVRCWQEMPTDLPNLPLRSDIRHNVFLAIKEACNNVLKHSSATEVWLRLALEDSMVRFAIEDNGRGFDLSRVAGSGNGLTNMQTRLEECGGRTEVISSLGQGTKVRFEFPLPNGGAIAGISG